MKLKRLLVIVVSLILLLLLILHCWVPRPLFDKPTSTVVMDCRGDLLGALIADDEQWRFPEVDSLSDKFIECIVNYEDRRFWKHWGVDFVAIVRAACHDIAAGGVVEGGSTITMQLARMARGNRSRNFLQKFIEVLWAVDIEFTYSKNDILQLYASNAPFGGNIVGIEAASWRYFGRKAYELSWAECATLAVLPNSPALIHVSRNREALLKKRNDLLRTLQLRGVLSDSECELAISEPLPDVPFAIPNTTPHLTARISRDWAGQAIRTTINSSLQSRVQQMADRYSQSYKLNFIDDIAVIVAEVESGNVIAYVGNSSQKSATSMVDNVCAERSTGSVLKPILYAAMLSDGSITPKRLFADVPLNINGFCPQNFSKKFCGAVPANDAVRRSLNVPLVRMLSQYNVGRFMGVLRWLGMTTLRYGEDHYGASLILGGAEGSLWNMAGMYASMSRTLLHYKSFDNKYCSTDIHPLTLVHVEKRDSTMVDDSRLSASSIWFAYEAMSGLNRPEEEADWHLFSSMKRVAWKTGTSWGNRDAWAIGTTPKYVVGVWVGNSSGEGRAGMTGVGFAAPVMFDVFSMLQNSEWFECPYYDMEQVVVCRNSGCLASPICAEVDTVLVPLRSINTEVCPYCRLVHLSLDGKWQVNSSCEPIANIRTESRFVLPATQEYYYRKQNQTYRSEPPLRCDCSGNVAEPFSIVYPEHGAIIVLPRNFDGETEHCVFRAVARDASAIIYWHIDDCYIGPTTGLHEIAVRPTVGEHVLTAVDASGFRKAVVFSVK